MVLKRKVYDGEAVSEKLWWKRSYMRILLDVLLISRFKMEKRSMLHRERLVDRKRDRNRNKDNLG